MTEADRNALSRLLGDGERGRATTDDLQGLLLQVVFALLMVFMIAYFIFIAGQKKARAEEIMEVNRQKIILAIEKVAEDHRMRYGLNALMVQGTDGKRTFEPDEHVKDGHLALAPAARTAFAGGSKAAYCDYSEPERLLADWHTNVLAEAKLELAKLTEDEKAWMSKSIDTEIENVRLDVRGVQRSLAVRLQKQWIESPETFGESLDVSDIARELGNRSLKLVSEACESEVLP